MLKLNFRKSILVWIFSVSVFSGSSQTIFYQSFDTTWTTISSLPGWSGTLSPANSLWHKNSYTTGWSSGTTGAYSPGGGNGTSSSARFHSCGASSGALGNITTPSIDCSAYGGNKRLSFYYINGSSGTDELDVYVSYNGGISWSSSLLRLRQGSGWIRHIIPLGKTSVTNLRIRFEAGQGGSAGSSDIGVDEVSVQNYSQSYTGLPYTQSFESLWTSNGGTRDIPDLYWTNCPATRDASWRRQDDGASASWGSSTAGIVTASGSSYSADFHSYNAESGHFGYLDLYADFSEAGSKQLTFNYQNASPGDQLNVYLSVDGGQTFGTPLAALSTGNWSGQTVDLGSSVSSSCVIRFMATSDKGYDDIGIDNVSIEVLAPLPLKLLDFSAAESADGVVLGWKTGSADSFSRFIPERSRNGAGFEPVAIVWGGEREYTCTIPGKAPAGMDYYRIACLKHSGTMEYSDIIPLKIHSTGKVVVTSIPGGLIRICSNDPVPHNALLVVYDLYGRPIGTFTVQGAGNAACEEILLNGLKQGMYLLSVQEGEDLVFKKIYIRRNPE